MNKNMIKTAAAALFVTMALGGCAGPSAQPLPQSTDCTAVGVTCEHPSDAPIATATDTPTPAETSVASTPSTCDVAREALLTGTPAKIKQSMQALVADKTASAKAREYAKSYLDATGDYKKSEQDMYVSMIQMYCSTP